MQERDAGNVRADLAVRAFVDGLSDILACLPHIWAASMHLYLPAGSG